MNRRTAVALTIGLSSIGLLTGSGSGHAQQSDADKNRAAIDGFHTAISSLDIRKMDDVWVHEPYAMVVPEIHGSFPSPPIGCHSARFSEPSAFMTKI
jgi:hypothetical protein